MTGRNGTWRVGGLLVLGLVVAVSAWLWLDSPDGDGGAGRSPRLGPRPAAPTPVRWAGPQQEDALAAPLELPEEPPAEPSSGAPAHGPVATISGLVVLPDGAPAAGARVVLHRQAGVAQLVLSGGLEQAQDADDQGRFTFREVDASLVHVIAAERDGDRCEPLVQLELEPFQELDVGVLALLPASGVQGTVTALGGQPVAGAEVRASGGDERIWPGLAEERRTTTDGGGRYRIDGLLPTACGLQASAAGHGGAGLAEVALSPGELVQVDLVLPHELTIAGRVVDASGAPLAGARVSALRSGPERDEAAVPAVLSAKGSGEFELRGLHAGVYRVTARAEGFGRRIVRDIAAGATGLELTLVRQGGLELVVLEAAGRPADAFTVLLRPRLPQLALLGGDPGLARWTRVDFGPKAGGRAWIAPLRRSSYDVAVHGADGSSSPLAVVEIRDEETVLLSPVRLSVPRALSGQVVDTDGQGIEAVELRLEASQERTDLPAGRAWSEPEGSFLFTPVPPGELVLTAERRGWVSTEVTIPSQHSGALSVVLQRGGGLRIVAGADFTRRHPGPYSVLVEQERSGARLVVDDVTGVLELEDLAPGAYLVELVPHDPWLDGDEPGELAPEPPDPDDVELQRVRRVEVVAGDVSVASF